MSVVLDNLLKRLEPFLQTPNLEELFAVRPQEIRIRLAGQQEKERFKTVCERAARRCQVSARKPPPKTFCGFCQAKGCPVVFEGNNAWETRMEHVGRHLEAAKGENMKWEEDIDLRNWLVSEGLLKQIGRNQFRLTDLVKAEEVKAGKR